MPHRTLKIEYCTDLFCYSPIHSLRKESTMKKSKTIKFKKRNPARVPATKKPFDFNAYDDADALVDAYFKYKHGRSMEDVASKLFTPDAFEIADLIMSYGDRPEHEELELQRTNKKYREWIKNAEPFEDACQASAILRDDDDAPEEWQLLTPDTLEFVRFNFHNSADQINERAKRDPRYDSFMYLTSQYNDYEDESNKPFWFAVIDLAEFFDFAPKK